MYDLAKAYQDSVKNNQSLKAARTATYRQILNGNGSQAAKIQEPASPQPLPVKKEFTSAEIDDMFSYS